MIFQFVVPSEIDDTYCLQSTLVEIPGNIHFQTMAVMDAENIEGSLAIEMMDRRKCLNTKNQYRLKVEHFGTSWSIPPLIDTDFSCLDIFCRP
jgi:hypothetical protein